MASTINASTSPAAIVQTADGTAILALQTGNTTAVTIDASQNVGIGITSPVGKLHVRTGIDSNLEVQTSTVITGVQLLSINNARNVYGPIELSGSQNVFYTNGTERMRIDSSGYVMVGTTSQVASGKVSISYAGNTLQGLAFNDTASNATAQALRFLSGGTLVGYIQTSTTATTYVTSSDYRLKENIAPITGALDKVAQLKPVTYKWKINGSDGQGFIAHELQAIIPDCVSGEKDAVNEDGSIKPQGIDTSFLVATLTAAIQELAKASSEQQALITSLTARITALEGA